MHPYFILLIAFGFLCTGVVLLCCYKKIQELQKRVSDLEVQVDAYLKEHLDDYIDDKYKYRG